MNILEVKVMRGPNFWSVYRDQIIQLKVNIGKYEDLPTNKIPDFFERISSIMPSLYTHRCSEKKPGGFFERIKEGTWMGHVGEHTALELQSLAGMECGYGRTRSTNKVGVYHVVFSYLYKEAGIYAGHAAFRMLNAICEGKDYNIKEDIIQLEKIRKEHDPGEAIKALAEEARSRKIPYRFVEGVSELILGHGIHRKIINSESANQITAKDLLDSIFPGNNSGRIPLVAVTGTNGKTTTTRLIAHIARRAGHVTGYTTTDGIYIQKTLVKAGDCSGPASATIILSDPSVNFAVLESARGGILRAGLGFDGCSTSVITNVTEDHLGLADIDSVKDLAKVKEVVANSTLDEGCTVLNADDDLVYRMRKDLDCRYALFSINSESERIAEHAGKGGLVATVEQECFVIIDGGKKRMLKKVTEVPLTLGGRSACMISNTLAAILAAYAENISPDIISESLSDFIPSAEHTPGRMNLFQFDGFQLMADYAHNTDGFKQLKYFLERTEASRKTGIIACTGDRRDEDIMLMGKYAAEMFDQVIIRHDKDRRGRTNDELSALIQKGIDQSERKVNVMVISEEFSAIDFALKNAMPGEFIFHCCDSVSKTLEYISAKQLIHKLENADAISK